ncbi:copper tolerance protein [Mesorhizobium sp. L103C105A0]|nr:copper tolerance protein [Mesorhizobium sp. L103C120A0]ESZ71815.1 copper tolerance protein [Mesorhizobium sp. L103C105A0]
MRVKLDKTFVPAGKVTFQVQNTSKDTVHEMIVVPIADAKKTTLPYVPNENRVNEDAAGHLGEVSELDPGKTGSLTLDLKPGSYAVFCNIPGHFMNGMWATILVK